MSEKHYSNGLNHDSLKKWEHAVAEHQHWLRTVAFSRVGNLHAVEDVMQEVAVAALKQKPKLACLENVQAWLYQVTVRQSLLYRRRLGREKRRTDRLQRQHESNGKPSSEACPLIWLLADEERQLVRQAIERLRSKDREILLLKYTEHWTCRDLAGHLGLSVTAVETRLDRARQRMRRELARVEITEDNR